MLQLIILCCAAFVASVPIDDASLDTLESSKEMELHRINSSLLAMSERVLEDLSISSNVSAQLYQEISVQHWYMYAAMEELNRQIKRFDNPHVDVDFSKCIQQYNQLANAAQSTILNISECTALGIQRYYTQGTYKKIMEEIELCEKDSVHAPETTMDCYLNARTAINGFLDSTNKSKFKIISPSESFIQQILTDCKVANNFNSVKKQLLTITENTEKCINDAKWDDTILGQIGRHFFTTRNLLCNGSFLIKSLFCLTSF